MNIPRVIAIQLSKTSKLSLSRDKTSQKDRMMTRVMLKTRRKRVRKIAVFLAIQSKNCWENESSKRRTIKRVLKLTKILPSNKHRKIEPMTMMRTTQTKTHQIRMIKTRISMAHQQLLTKNSKGKLSAIYFSNVLKNVLDLVIIKLLQTDIKSTVGKKVPH